MADEFHEPRFRAPVELEAQIALLPPRATCKGMFFVDPIERARRRDPGADVLRAAGLAGKRYLPFLDYPHAEWMRVTHAAAAVVSPTGHVGDGLRELGRHAYDVIFANPLGKLLFGPFGFDLERVFAHAGLGYRLGLSFGTVRSERVGPQHYRVVFRDFPSFLETFNVGVLEGSAAHYGDAATVRVKTEGLAHATMDVVWK